MNAFFIPQCSVLWQCSSDAQVKIKRGRYDSQNFFPLDLQHKARPQSSFRTKPWQSIKTKIEISNVNNWYLWLVLGLTIYKYFKRLSTYQELHSNHNWFFSDMMWTLSQMFSCSLLYPAATRWKQAGASPGCLAVKVQWQPSNKIPKECPLLNVCNTNHSLANSGALFSEYLEQHMEIAKLSHLKSKNRKCWRSEIKAKSIQGTQQVQIVS